jgi:hypothetical protein
MHRNILCPVLLFLSVIFLLYWLIDKKDKCPPQSLSSVLELLQQQPNLSLEQQEILANKSNWMGVKGSCEWTYHFPANDPRSDHSWHIFFDSRTNEWVLKDPYHGYPHGYPHGYSYAYPSYAPYTYPYAYAYPYAYPYASPYTSPYAYANPYGYGYSSYAYPYSSAPLISPYDPQFSLHSRETKHLYPNNVVPPKDFELQKVSLSSSKTSAAGPV